MRSRRTAAAVAATVTAVAVVVGGAQALRPERAPAAAPDPAPPAAPEGEVVPWALRLAPQETGEVRWPAPEQGPPCSVEDLDVEASPPTEQPPRDGRLAQVRTVVLVTNRGSACSLPPEAGGALLDEDGGRLPLAGDVAFGGPAHPPPPLLASTATASAAVSWSRWCGDHPGRWSVSLELAGRSEEVRVPGDAPPVPGCADGADGAVYDFGVWTVLNEAGQPALDPQAALQASVSGPGRGRLGQVLPMVLRLSNPTRGPVPLDPCPVFTWSVSRSGPGSFLRSSPPLALNCPQAPDAVPAGGSVDFALELTLSPALADGMLAPGEWWVHPAVAGAEPRRVTVLPPVAARPEDPAACEWVVPPDAEPRVPGVPPASVPRRTRSAVLHTNRGDLGLELDGVRSPCAVAAFEHHVRGGYWDGRPCYLLSTSPTFRNVDCGSAELAAVQAGFAFPSEARADSDYPAGTVVLTHDETLPHAGSLRILYGDAPTYADDFTVLGRITSGIEVVQAVAAGGQRDGEYAGPRLALTIEDVTLRG